MVNTYNSRSSIVMFMAQTRLEVNCKCVTLQLGMLYKFLGNRGADDTIGMDSVESVFKLVCVVERVHDVSLLLFTTGL